jgi:protein SOK2
MVQSYSYEPLPPPSAQHHTYQPAPLHIFSSSVSDPRTLQPLGTSSSQPYPHSPYAYPPPPPDMPMDYRQPSSPNYTHEQSLPLPPISAPVEQGYGSPPAMDTTGQVAPPGMRPRLTTSIFEEEGSLCFQVDVNGICVARREGTFHQTCRSLVARLMGSDNHMINGTKLLNVARMTRGRRDGILKAEKQKNVVKIGPMHLKGVWYALPISNSSPLHIPATPLNPSFLPTTTPPQDPIRARPRARKPRKYYRTSLPPLRAQHPRPALPPHQRRASRPLTADL